MVLADVSYLVPVRVVARIDLPTAAVRIGECLDQLVCEDLRDEIQRAESLVTVIGAAVVAVLAVLAWRIEGGPRRQDHGIKVRGMVECRVEAVDHVLHDILGITLRKRIGWIRQHDPVPVRVHVAARARVVAELAAIGRIKHLLDRGLHLGCAGRETSALPGIAVEQERHMGMHHDRVAAERHGGVR